MFILLVLILIVQFFTYWIYDPLATFIEYILEIRFFPIIALVSLILLFSTKNIK